MLVLVIDADFVGVFAHCPDFKKKKSKLMFVLASLCRLEQFIMSFKWKCWPPLRFIRFSFDKK